MKDSEHKHAFLDLASQPDQVTLNIIDEFNNIVRSSGCSLHLHTGSDGTRTLMLSINCETAKNSRNAGRRKKLVTNEHRHITCGEVRKMLKTKSAEEVAAELGVSRSTLFRRLKDKDDCRRF